MRQQQQQNNAALKREREREKKDECSSHTHNSFHAAHDGPYLICSSKVVAFFWIISGGRERVKAQDGEEKKTNTRNNND